MSVCSSWIHGNAIMLESPLHFNPEGEQNGRLVLTPFGWGAEVSVEGHPAVSWVHLPIPTVNWLVGRFERLELVRVFLLFECSNATVEDVHIYDGHEKVAEFNGQARQGRFLTKGVQNTFELKKPHRMKTGVGLSFLYKPQTNAVPPGTLFVSAAGAEFEIGSIFFRAIGDTVFNRVTRREP
jgi:hypothetical protein